MKMDKEIKKRLDAMEYAQFNFVKVLLENIKSNKKEQKEIKELLI